MSWNYRVCRYTQGGETLFAIREVFYDSQGRVAGHTPATVDDWDTRKDLKGTLRLMLEACDKPIMTIDGTLDDDDVPELGREWFRKAKRIQDGPDALRKAMLAFRRKRKAKKRKTKNSKTG